MAKILIVEDNGSNMKLMEYLLRAFGHTALTARDGEAGLTAALEHRPELVLMDLHMPTMDGFESCRRMREHDILRAMPIVAVTASAMVGDRDLILARGFDGYIAKPITPETFVQQVEQFIPAGREGVQ
ncbi:MAG: response regulator [Vicinamibacterales bacterium]